MRDVHPMIGTIIDKKYRICAVLGEGGMGTVFEAEHLVLQRSVALKLIRPSASDPSRAMKRMQHEARIAGAIGHPHICDVYDIGEMPDGSPYLVMQRLVGETLADSIARQHRFPALQAVQIMIEVLSGLHSAHLMKIVHRDLKPQNIFLASRRGCDPLAKVLDFGLSKRSPAVSRLSAELTSLTSAGACVGTPFYMAPEQLVGTDVDGRADLFACGVVLYETLARRLPFPGPSIDELVRQIRAASPPPLSAWRRDLPREMDVVMRRALSRDLKDRYQSAGDFQDALHALRATLAARSVARVGAASLDALPSLADSHASGFNSDSVVIGVQHIASADVVEEDATKANGRAVVARDSASDLGTEDTQIGPRSDPFAEPSAPSDVPPFTHGAQLAPAVPAPPAPDAQRLALDRPTTRRGKRDPGKTPSRE